MTKISLLTISGAVGTILINILGGFNQSLITLIVFMAVDMITGTMVAGVFNNSEKTESGKLSSSIFAKGIVRKLMIISCVALANMLDSYLGIHVIREGVIVAFIVNELISFIENMDRAGMEVPAPLRNAVQLLQNKSDTTQRKGE